MTEGECDLLVKEQDHKTKLVDLTDGAEEALVMLRVEVEKSKGVARVLVHPRFNPYSLLHPLTDEYLDQVEGFINTSPTSHAPLIVFEEEEEVGRLDDLIGQLPQTFLVRTIPEDPLPATDVMKAVLDKPLSKAEAFALEQKAERELYGGLKGAGIKKVIIGGRYFFLGEENDDNHDFKSFISDTDHSPSNRDWLELKKYPKGCVGGVVAASMREGIEVVVSHAVSPHTIPEFSDRHKVA